MTATIQDNRLLSAAPRHSKKIDPDHVTSRRFSFHCSAMVRESRGSTVLYLSRRAVVADPLLSHAPETDDVAEGPGFGDHILELLGGLEILWGQIAKELTETANIIIT